MNLTTKAETDAKDDHTGVRKSEEFAGICSCQSSCLTLVIVLVQTDGIASDAMSVDNINVESKANDVQRLPTGSKGVLSPPTLLTGVTKTENDAFKGDQSLFLSSLLRLI